MQYRIIETDKETDLRRTGYRIVSEEERRKRRLALNYEETIITPLPEPISPKQRQYEPPEKLGFPEALGQSALGLLRKPGELLQKGLHAIDPVAQKVEEQAPKTLTGIAEVGVTLPTGISSFIASVLGKTGAGVVELAKREPLDQIKDLYNIWKTGGGSISDIEDIPVVGDIFKGVKNSEQIGEFIQKKFGVESKTSEGQQIISIILFPIELYMAGVNEVAKISSDDPKEQSTIRYLGDLALLFAIPKARAYVNRAIKTKTPIVASKLQEMMQKPKKLMRPEEHVAREKIITRHIGKTVPKDALEPPPQEPALPIPEPISKPKYVIVKEKPIVEKPLKLEKKPIVPKEKPVPTKYRVMDDALLESRAKVGDTKARAEIDRRYIRPDIDAMYNDVIKTQQERRTKGYLKLEKRTTKDIGLTSKVAEKIIRDIPLEESTKIKLRAKKKDPGFFREVMEYEALLKNHPEAKNDIRKFADTHFDAREDATHKIVATVGKLSKQDQRVFRGIVGFKSMEQMAKGGKPIPRGITLNEVKKTISELESKKNPLIEEALQRHIDIVDMYREELIARGKLDTDTPKGTYYHHRVLEYVPSGMSYTGLPSKLKKPFEGYLRRRVGGKQYSFDYISSMHDYYSRVFLDLATEDFMLDMASKYDISTTAKLKNIKPRTEYLEGDKVYRGYQYEDGNAFYPSTMVNESLLQRAIAENLTVAEFMDMTGVKGGKAIRKGTALGKRHKVYLLPREIALKLERFRDKGTANEMMRVLHYGTSMWKRITLDFAGIPFQVANFFGDAINLYKTDPKAFTMLRASTDLTLKRIFAPEKLTEKQKSMSELLREQRVTTTNMLREAGIDMNIDNILKKIKNPDNPWNYFASLFKGYEKVSVAREEILRTAKFMKDIERIAKGKQVVAGEFMAKGLKPIDAAGYTARNFTIDYGAVSPKYRSAIRGILFPFATFYDYNFRNWTKYAARRPGNFALKVLIPSVAMWAWNNGVIPVGDYNERKKIEEDLGFWRWLPHVVTGWNYPGTDKPLVLAMQTPIDMAVGVVGLDKLPAKITDIRSGRMTIKEAAVQQLKDTFKGAPETMLRLLNPLAQAIGGIIANRDPYLGKVIVPPRFKGTEYEGKFIVEFVLSKVMSPYGQYLRAQSIAEREPSLDGQTAFLTKGPLDVFRAFGMRKIDTDLTKIFQGYEKRSELSDNIKKKLAVIEMSWLAANRKKHWVDGQELLNKAWKKAENMEGDNPTPEQIFNRLWGYRTQKLLLKQLVARPDLTKEQREYYKELYITVSKMDFTEDMMKNSMKAIRESLGKELEKIFKK